MLRALGVRFVKTCSPWLVYLQIFFLHERTLISQVIHLIYKYSCFPYYLWHQSTHLPEQGLQNSTNTPRSRIRHLFLRQQTTVHVGASSSLGLDVFRILCSIRSIFHRRWKALTDIGNECRKGVDEGTRRRTSTSIGVELRQSIRQCRLPYVICHSGRGASIGLESLRQGREEYPSSQVTRY